MRASKQIIISVAAISVITATAVSVPSSAQPAGASEQARAAKKKPVCMSRPMANVEQVQKSKRGKANYVLITEHGVPAFEAKGFVRTTCGQAKLTAPKKRTAYRDQMCELAASGNEAVQNQIEMALGERPAVLCAYAEQAAGMWQKKPKRRP